MDPPTVDADASAGGHDAIAMMKVIAEFRQAVIRTRRCDIDIGGTFHTQDFMRSFAIESITELIELFLLLQRVHRWRTVV